MTDATVMRGRAMAEDLYGSVRDDVEALRARGVTPRLGTVLMTDDPAAESFMDRKHERCAALGVPTERVDVSPDAPASALYDAVEGLADADDVTALFVQVPLPDHVDPGAVRARVPQSKDADCFAPVNLGRLVNGDPRVTPATPAAVRRLLAGYGVETAGRDAVVVGRTAAICRPLANMLLARGPGGDATVTVCHTATADLAARTRDADLLVTAAGHPHLVDGSMLSAGVTVVDISVNRVERGGERELVGDVHFESAREKAAAITPVPGGVGPMTLACLLRNVVDLTARAAGVESALSSDRDR